MPDYAAAATLSEIFRWLPAAIYAAGRRCQAAVDADAAIFAVDTYYVSPMSASADTFR